MRPDPRSSPLPADLRALAVLERGEHGDQPGLGEVDGLDRPVGLVEHLPERELDGPNSFLIKK